MNIGGAIKHLREGLSISQKELGERCYISQSNLSRIETGSYKPNPGTVSKICSMLDIPESLIYLMAIQEKDVAESKKNVYHLLYPMIKDLAMQIAASPSQSPARGGDVV